MSESTPELVSGPLVAESAASIEPTDTPKTEEAEAEESRTPTPATSAPGAPAFPWAPPSSEEALDKRKTIYTPEEKAEAWKETTQVVQRYSDEMIKRWNAEIDTYLVFAGLFSAVLTAFNVQSYVLLQPAGPDPTLAALQQISLQLSSFSSTGTFVNSTHPAFEQTNSPPPPVPRSAVWLNTLWFTSLILSLSSASIGMLVKQWLNEYASGLSSENSRQTARLRQYRLNGLVTWRVGDIVNVIPVLLQLAVALFLAGLLILLWTLDSTVATVASVFTSLLAAFAFATIILPSIRRGCAYLSPQSLGFYYALHHGTYYLIKIPVWRVLEALQDRLVTMRYRRRSTTTSAKLLRSLADFISLFTPHEPRTWRGREQSEVSTWQRFSLDADVITQAYDTSLNSRFLAVCLSELGPMDVPGCLQRLHKAEGRQFGSDNVHYHLVVAQAAEPTVMQDLWAESLLCLYVARPRDDRIELAKFTEPWEDALQRILYRLSLHFHLTPTSERLPNARAGSVERVMAALSMLTTINLEPPHPSPAGIYYSLMLDIITDMLAWCDFHGVPISNDVLRQVAAVLYQQLTTTAPKAPRNTLYRYLPTVICFLECIARRTTVLTEATTDEREATLLCVDHALGDLTVGLQELNTASFGSSSSAVLSLVTGPLSTLVNFVTEEPRAAPLLPLLSRDRIFALKHAVTVVRDTIRLRGGSEDEYKIFNRAGKKERLKDKFIRLRALAARSSDVPQTRFHVRPSAAPADLPPSFPAGSPAT